MAAVGDYFSKELAVVAWRANESSDILKEGAEDCVQAKIRLALRCMKDWGDRADAIRDGIGVTDLQANFRCQVVSSKGAVAAKAALDAILVRPDEPLDRTIEAANRALSLWASDVKKPMSQHLKERGRFYRTFLSKFEEKRGVAVPLVRRVMADQAQFFRQAEAARGSAPSTDQSALDVRAFAVRRLAELDAFNEKLKLAKRYREQVTAVNRLVGEIFPVRASPDGEASGGAGGGSVPSQDWSKVTYREEKRVLNAIGTMLRYRTEALGK